MANAGLVWFMYISITLLLIGFVVLLCMVHFDLGPMGKLSTGRKWLMSLALGSGMVAFSIKLLIIVTLVGFPAATIKAHIVEKPSSLRASWEDGNHVHEMPAVAGIAKSYVWQALPQVAPAPAWNPTTPEKVALGERLFHDKALSLDRTVSCSSCHEVHGGAGVDHRRTSLGIKGQVGGRNAPTVWNAAFQAVLFWDGRAASLEDQAKGPPLNPIEMGMPSVEALERRVREDASYRESFRHAFGDEHIDITRITAAIAAYERTLITPDAPYDRFVRGDANALAPAQLRGMELFQSVGCVLCHSGPNFSGASLFDLSQSPYRLFPVFPGSELVERYRLTRDSGANPHGSKQAVWRIPSLRNVALTAPYLHNGSVDSLREVVRIMATAQRGRTLGEGVQRTVVWSPQERTIGRVEVMPLSERDVDDIVAFLNALSSESLVARSRARHSGVAVD